MHWQCLSTTDGEFFCFTRREPVGVCGQIVPVSDLSARSFAVLMPQISFAELHYLLVESFEIASVQYDLHSSGTSPSSCWRGSGAPRSRAAARSSSNLPIRPRSPLSPWPLSPRRSEVCCVERLISITFDISLRATPIFIAINSALFLFLRISIHCVSGWISSRGCQRCSRFWGKSRRCPQFSRGCR